MAVEPISSYKLVSAKKDNESDQPIFLSQPHHEGSHTLSAQIALRSFGANRNNVIGTPCFIISLAIRQSPHKKGYLTQHRKPPRIKG